ncbi:hypothetical protein CIPAW_01G166500 [Carya illinoinensis]|uniref:Uncharacterized protein n=1 Tax=Carya illinoinensis TaxID=32201 RepID=A0A8T1RNN6_CARIL|nr:hypothetical protein CIPAW_01G166500 [Carya illinoinensis]
MTNAWKRDKPWHSTSPRPSAPSSLALFVSLCSSVISQRNLQTLSLNLQISFPILPNPTFQLPKMSPTWASMSAMAPMMSIIMRLVKFVNPSLYSTSIHFHFFWLKL